ncbi:Pyridoxamine 5'-phosphate oxidase [Nonomuraea coxensis DSM 45129]|uniref:Pyridoxamine 5'-phosphate oxidase n=1 Tax=Nonomuraea coxensis DSM 45129 TaxID=1122611 RepID=A0ABX8TR28_9ACTN|nr:pyridoxamine 5'-phosphate oxidase family protein [Nonomuraea coxensis]QYC37940.1 Pyridoxamine 5'-phosphate oxidase [Nonomuraea coxensis DSM 45129]
MQLDSDVLEVLSEVKVLELGTIARDGGLDVRPMAATWIADTQQIAITTPLAYAQKTFNIRRDGRVSVLYSDFTGSGLSGKSAILVQGVATAPDVVARPEDIKEYWRELFRKTPGLTEEFASDEAKATMDWYYLRLPVFVTPERVHVLEPVEAGGSFEPFPPWGAPMGEQIEDALTRYPSAAFASRDAGGHPYAVRARISAGDDGKLRVRTAQDFEGRIGPATLLWHRHNGQSGDMCSLHVAGTAIGSGTEWEFHPERIPGSSAADDGANDDWIADARARTERYLKRRGITPAPIDWAELAVLARA